MPKRSPHPNATTLFVNWLMTKEGMAVFSKGYGHPSSRLDAPGEEVNPALRPPKELKIYPSSEEYIMVKDEMTKEAKKIIDEFK